MSAGSIDDRLGPQGELEQLRSEHADLDEYLSAADSYPIIRADIPFGAGISTNGETRYIDRRLDTILDGIDVSPALAVHETVEWALREFCSIGLDYSTDPRGHRLANRAEYEKVLELAHKAASAGVWVISDKTDEDLWDAYDELMDPQLRRIQTEPLTLVPADLAMYPYEGTEWEEKIREAQDA